MKPAIKYEMPQIGKLVKITTRWPDINIFAKKATIDSVITGTVVVNHKLTPIGCFSVIVDGSHVPLREIDLGHVVNIEYVDESITAAVTEVITDTISVQVPGSNGAFYIVTQSNGKYSCSCSGFQFRKKCKHVIQVAASYA